MSNLKVETIMCLGKMFASDPFQTSHNALDLNERSDLPAPNGAAAAPHSPRASRDSDYTREEKEEKEETDELTYDEDSWLEMDTSADSDSLRHTVVAPVSLHTVPLQECSGRSAEILEQSLQADHIGHWGPEEHSWSLTRTTSIADLHGWLAGHANTWVTDEGLSAESLSEGQALVYNICTASSQTKDAENQCYILFLDCCRGIRDQFTGGAQKTAMCQLISVFEFLDQQFTNTKNTPGMVRGKQSTSKICAGQDLQTSAANIATDPLWIPDYEVAPGPATLLRDVSTDGASGSASTKTTKANISNLDATLKTTHALPKEMCPDRGLAARQNLQAQRNRQLVQRRTWLDQLDRMFSCCFPNS